MSPFAWPPEIGVASFSARTPVLKPYTPMIVAQESTPTTPSAERFLLVFPPPSDYVVLIGALWLSTVQGKQGGI
jgi:hypothetical protein